MSLCHHCPCDGGDEAEEKGGSDHGGGSGGGVLGDSVGLGLEVYKTVTNKVSFNSICG